MAVPQRLKSEDRPRSAPRAGKNMEKLTIKRPDINAFSIEDERSAKRSVISKDIESYLGEYRFELSVYEYKLALNNYGEICSVFDNEPMRTKGERAIKKRKKQGVSVNREMADLKGMMSLEDQLKERENGNSILWISPPGPGSQGYGDYGFIYAGKRYEDTIFMTAIRIEHPTIEQFNHAYSQITGKSVRYQSAEDFIANPIVLPTDPKQFETHLDNVLQDIFTFENVQENVNAFNNAMPILKPLINHFVDMVEQGKSEQELKVILNAIENYAIELKDRALNKPYELYQEVEKKPDFKQIIYQYGYKKPAPVAGSCGSTSSDKSSTLKSNNVFDLFSSLKDLFSEKKERKFICPNCKAELTPPVGNECPECGMTKKKWAEQSKEPICN